MPSATDHWEISTLFGTPKRVRDQLVHSTAGSVLVVAFSHIEQVALKTLVQNVDNVTSTMFDLLTEPHDRESLERLAELMVPRKPPSPRLLKEAAMLARAREAVLKSGDWLTAAEVAQLAGLSTSNPSARTCKWKKGGRIFAINHRGVDYFPGYGLDRGTGFRPVEALATIIEIFKGRKDGWGMAYWFLSDNSFLGGKRPQDLLATAPGRVIEAARDAVQEIAHG